MSFCRSGHDTHAGRVRAHNEDCYLLDHELGLGVLADGMGGHEGGEIASRIVVESVREQVHNGKSMAQALVGAHKAVLQAVVDGKGRKGMGATALAARIDGDDFEVVWVGDSRAYLWDQDQLIRLTTDHSLVQEMVEKGEISPDEADSHPKRNFITQAIGMSELRTLKVGRVKGHIFPGQQLLLCTDGLSGEVPGDEIAEILRLGLGEQEKVDLLIECALEHGGSDNITVMLLSPAGGAAQTA
jgi:protein phosphatase